MSFNFSSTAPSASESQARNAFINLYFESQYFSAFVDYINTHKTNPRVLIKITDNGPGPHMEAYPENPSDDEKGYDFVIRIPVQKFDVCDYFAVDANKDGVPDSGYPDANNDGVPDNAISNSYERIIAHEVTHIVHYLSEGPSQSQSESDTRHEEVVRVEDFIMGDAYGEGTTDANGDPVGRGSYANPFYNNNCGVPNFKDDSQAPTLPHGMLPGPTSPPVEGATGQIDAASKRGSPLVLDLDHSGTVDLISLENSGAYFDRDQDGFAEWSGVAANEDGYLAIDLNKNGKIDDNSELFGTVEIDGFTILAEYDSNADGKITAEDSVWDDLIIWQDHNEDGVSESDELYDLLAHDIISIDLNATVVSQTNQGHEITHTSTFTTDDGVSGPQNYKIHDVWFEFDNVNTTYVGEYAINVNAVLLGVNLRGYGTLATLHIAMSLDDNGTNNLLGQITSLSDLSFAQIFDGTNNTLDAVRDILFRWAGVDGVATDSRGRQIDARELEFLEELTGQEWLQNGYRPDPGPEASWNLERAFNIMLNNTFAHLVGQIVGDELFEGNWHYNLSTDAIEGITGLNSDAIDTLEIEATALSATTEKEIFWQNVVRVVEFNIGYDNMSSGDKTLLNNAIIASDATLNLVDVISSLDVSETQYGQDGNDLIQGDIYTNNTLFGYAGNDRLEGMAGNDELTGGADDDYLLGGFDNDIYHYASGDGFDAIREQGHGTGHNADEIRFGAGIDANDLTFTRIGESGLLIDIDNGVDVGQIWLEFQFNNASNGPGYVETIRFSDNSTIDIMSLVHSTYGTSGNDKIWGIQAGGSTTDTIYAGAGDDIVYADNGNDTVYGEDGNDTLYGDYGDDTLNGGAGDDTLSGGADNDTLIGGAGNDLVYGGAGDDIYHYISGHDTFDESSGTDQIALDAVWNSVTPIYYKQGVDLKIVFDSNNTILIKAYFSSSSGKIESMVYANSTSVNLATVSYIVQGDETNNTLSGTASDDTLYGFGGDDVLNGSGGSNGNDTLYGGTGNDTLNGGYGDDYLDGGAGNDTLEGNGNNDTYYYVSGHDVIIDSSGTELLIMAPGWALEDITFKRYYNNGYDLVLEINGSNSITIEGQFYGNYQVETLKFSDNSTVNLATQVYTTYGDEGNNSISELMVGGSLNEIFYGLGGNDTINGGNGDDTLHGGTGNDTLNGEGNNDTLYGEDGDDTLNGGIGNDYLDGGAGNDTLYGYNDNDTYFYSGGNDIILDSAGADVLIMSSEWEESDLTFRRDISDLYGLMISIDGTNSIFIDEQFYGDNNIETIEFADTTTINLLTKSIQTHGNASANSISGITVGASLDDIIYGYAGNDTLNGGNGNDTIYGGDDNDSIDGGNNNDVLYGGAGDDVLQGRSGDDTYVYAEGLDEIYDTSGVDTLWISNGVTVDSVSFSSIGADDTKIVINPGVDEVLVDRLRNGNSGLHIDKITFDDGFITSLPDYASWANGTSGSDSLTGTSADETILGFSGNDTLDGAGGADDIHGGAGNDTIYGGVGTDLLHGGIGDDVLYGQDGLDTLFGGAGADSFVFESATAFNNVDVIKDFSLSDDDVLDLSDLLSVFDPMTDAITDFVQITESGGNSSLFVDRDGTGGTYGLQQIATIQGVTGLTDEVTLYNAGTIIAA